MAGNKYSVDCKGMLIDVYDVLDAFGAACPASQHAIKKLLMPGKRGHKSELGDLIEARASVDRAIDLARERHAIEDAKAKQLDAIFSQGTSLTMGVCDDAPVSHALTDRELRITASLCRECGGTMIDGICQEKGCRYEALAPADVVSRKLPTGEVVAWDNRNNRQIASGFDDEDDFEDWKKERFRL